MITKNDCMSILVKLEDSGVDVNSAMRKLVIAKEIPIEVLKFIQINRGFEISNFYEMLRKKHNQNKSPLYTNIINEEANESEIITTLSALLTQISLYGRKIDNANAFYKAARAQEISEVLSKYYAEQDLNLAAKMLQAVRTDLVVLEYIAGRRDIA